MESLISELLPARHQVRSLDTHTRTHTQACRSFGSAYLAAEARHALRHQCQNNINGRGSRSTQRHVMCVRALKRTRRVAALSSSTHTIHTQTHERTRTKRSAKSCGASRGGLYKKKNGTRTGSARADYLPVCVNTPCSRMWRVRDHALSREVERGGRKRGGGPGGSVKVCP